jgi:hemerythrin-like domain-containing protein
LTVHASIEEQVLYPVMREHLSGGEEVVQEAMVEHGGAKKALATMSSQRR